MTTFKVMTYNVYMDGHKNKASAQETCAALLSVQVDVIFLQETNEKWEKVISNHSELVKNFPFRVFAHDRFPHGGFCVLSRFKVNYNPQQDLSERLFWGWFPAMRVELLLSDKLCVQVLNVHLRAAFPSNPCTVQRQRLEEVERHWNRTMKSRAHQMPSVVLGDFNSPHNAPCIQYFYEQCDIINSIEKNDSDPTYHWGYFKATFDHILYSKNHFTCEDAKVLKIGKSDHYPVLATLLVKPV